MGKTASQYIRLKEYLDEKEYTDISMLQKICAQTDKTELKLELDYKLGKAEDKNGLLKRNNEFMFYSGDELIGYIGICHFGGDALEVNGMVHPEYRRLGIFRKLYSLVQDEFNKRDVKKMLLLSDATSGAGVGFIKSVSASIEHSEFEMFLRNKEYENLQQNRISLRKASNKDAEEIAFQNSIYFGAEHEMIMPEEEEKCGMQIFIAETAGKAIGKIHLETNAGHGAIFGLGVLPEYRSNGYGREILRLGIAKLEELNVSDIKLQVVVKNQNALELYKSCGFEVASTMEYYQLEK